MTILAPQNKSWFIIIGFKHLSENNIAYLRAIIANPAAFLMCCHQLSVATMYLCHKIMFVNWQME